MRKLVVAIYHTAVERSAYEYRYIWGLCPAACVMDPRGLCATASHDDKLRLYVYSIYYNNNNNIILLRFNDFPHARLEFPISSVTFRREISHTKPIPDVDGFFFPPINNIRNYRYYIIIIQTPYSALTVAIYFYFLFPHPFLV